MGRRARSGNFGETKRVVATTATTMSFLGRRLGCFFSWFFTDLFFDLAAPLARQPGPEDSVEQIGKEKHRRHPLVIHHRENENETDGEKTRDRFFGFPIERLEARILKAAKHHKGKKKQ